MKHFELSPFVHKIKGVKNYLFHDLYYERLFHLAPSDISVEELKKQLMEKGLLFETNGIIPFKFKLDFEPLQNEVKLIELEIRLTGKCSENCPDCGDSCGCFITEHREIMSNEVFDSILSQFGKGCGKVPIKQLAITGGNPFFEERRLHSLLDSIEAENRFILFQKHELYPGIEGYDFVPNRTRGLSISDSAMECDDFSFFFRKMFHSCWGKKICVDVNGDIKLCLRHPLKFGNIQKDNVKQLIVNGVFDPYWELTKDDVATCKSCEYRYACFECRPDIEDDCDYSEKPKQCGYNPVTGEWKEPIKNNILEI